MTLSDNHAVDDTGGLPGKGSIHLGHTEIVPVEHILFFDFNSMGITRTLRLDREVLKLIAGSEAVQMRWIVRWIIWRSIGYVGSERTLILQRLL